MKPTRVQGQTQIWGLEFSQEKGFTRIDLTTLLGPDDPDDEDPDGWYRRAGLIPLPNMPDFNAVEDFGKYFEVWAGKEIRVYEYWSTLMGYSDTTIVTRGQANHLAFEIQVAPLLSFLCLEIRLPMIELTMQRAFLHAHDHEPATACSTCQTARERRERERERGRLEELAKKTKKKPGARRRSR